MIVFLVLTRHDARIVKRRPTARPGEWVLELRVEFPPAPKVPTMTVELPPIPELEGVHVELVEPEPEGEP